MNNKNDNVMDGLDNLFDEELENDINDTIDNEEDIQIAPENDLLFGEDDTVESKESNSLIDELLKAKGINSGKLTIIDEDEKEQEVDFYSLTKEEQLEILNSSEEENNYGLDESEQGLINHLRSNKLTVEQFLEGYKQSIVESLSNSENNSNYEIDAYDDEELYMLDLKNKFDLSDEELVKELEKELQDEALFKKKADKLREEYKQLEDQYKEAQKQEFEEKRQEQYNQFAQQMVDIAVSIPEFYGIELEDNEKNEVLSFLLELDDNGVSEFYKTLNDPKKLYEAAWFLRYGKESFDILKNAYESEISQLKAKDKKPIVVKRNNNEPKNSIHDLNF